MIYWVLLTVTLVLVVAVAARLARGSAPRLHELTELQSCTVAVDVASFRNLVDAREKRWLVTNLSAHDFRRIQRLRTRAAMEYVRQTARNAAAVLQAGEAARRAGDAEIAAHAERMIALAIRVRMLAVLALLQLLLEYISPASDVSALTCVTGYERLVAAVARVARMHSPAQASRITAAL